MRNLAPVIVLVLLWSALFAVEVINPGGVRNRLAPDHDRFLQRLPPPVRLVWFLVLLTIAVLSLAFAIFQAGSMGRGDSLHSLQPGATYACNETNPGRPQACPTRF